MPAEAAPVNDSTASWLPGGVLVLVQRNAVRSLRTPGIRHHVFKRDKTRWRMSLVCGHDAARRGALENSFGGVTCDWQTFVRERFASLDAATRGEITAFLATTLARPCCRRAGARRLAASLHSAREGLRERLPIGTPAPRQPLGLNVDALVAADERTFYARGWLHDDGAARVQLTAVSPEGARVELARNVFRFDRPDITALCGSEPGGKFGFIRHFELPAPSTLAEGWVFELHSESGDALEIISPKVVSDYVRARDSILADLALETPRHAELISRHIHPALGKLQARHHAAIEAANVQQYGTAPAQPEITVIVPLYQRIDFLEHQLAQFAHDAEFRSTADLIYVLDSPEQAEALAARAARLARLYEVPFRIATLNRNGGYSAANNIGAALARGRLLVLLNSDVLPDRPGWLARMAEFYRATPNVGALGPKLLFEDDTLQHAGLYFSPMPDCSGWENLHYFKGLHRALPAANLARAVPAVTAACLMLDRALYEKLSGLRGMYVQGDYEDSDLCLRLAAEGLENWYLPTVELYHLEGQSYPAPLRALTSRYNRWLHTHTWRAQIEAAMQRFGSTPCP